VNLVLPSEHPATVIAVHRALTEREAARRTRRDPLTWTVHEAQPRFVAGQAAAVLELMAGRPNLPVTTWRPAAERGHRNRPTLLSNAETFAHLARLALTDTPWGPSCDVEDALREDALREDALLEETGTTLLTLDGDTRTARVREVRLGTPWRDVLTTEEILSPVLLGGYHGTWAAPGSLDARAVDRDDLQAHALTLGAGVVLPLTSGCPVDRTRRLVAYLAGESAGRCGPCLNGLPALAAALEQVHARVVRTHADARAEVLRLASLVERRGACAHPDGTARLARSMLATFPDEVEAHATGRCTYDVRRTELAPRHPVEVTA
jgi:NADH:ubiquinone oxidoreductase subunit F (NADH-binding)